MSNYQENREKCCGCRACELICPRNAIEMKTDAEGFIYPFIDKEKCIECGKCTKVCAFSKGKTSERNNECRQYFLCRHNDKDVILTSRSGGVFVALSDYILSLQGNIYGVELTPDFIAHHARANNKKGRDKFCGSKYVQSDTEKTFDQVCGDLKNGKYVLYSGTPCQVAALYNYLNMRGNISLQEKLFTCDIICHGVMSPKIWQDNLAEIEKKYKTKIEKVNFRDKDYGWNTHIESYITPKGKINSSLYTDVFYDHLALRPSCYECQYTSLNRVSDITLGDGWGAEKHNAKWGDNLGVSLILINSLKGESLFNEVKSCMHVEQVDINDFMQPNLQHATLRPKGREQFWNDYKKNGYQFVAIKCQRRQKRIRRKNCFKANLLKLLKKIGLR